MNRFGHTPGIVRLAPRAGRPPSSARYEGRQESSDADPSQLSESADPLAIRERKLKILVVDDHADFRSALAEQLKTVYDANVQQEEDGLGALRAASTSFDLILMDVNMPRLDGLNACAEIRRLALPVAVALMTAMEPTPQLRRKVNALGAALLMKPVDAKALEGILLRSGAGGRPT